MLSHGRVLLLSLLGAAGHAAVVHQFADERGEALLIEPTHAARSRPSNTTSASLWLRLLLIVVVRLGLNAVPKLLRVRLELLLQMAEERSEPGRESHPRALL
jgi:hypothetical protein